MNQESTEALSVIVERDLPYPQEKIWHALTEPSLIEAWLMKNDFKPIVGHHFRLQAEWGSVDCKVLSVETNRKLSYTWTAFGVDTVVTWLLSPSKTGIQLHLEQSGFRPDQQQFYQGAQGGWNQFLTNFEQVLAR